MSTVEELQAICEEKYKDHNDAFQAWMDAQIELEEAIEEEDRLRRNADYARKSLFLAFLGFGFAALVAKVWG
jgi:hypothetical protein